MERIPQLDGLRGAAVLSVFLYHAIHPPLLWAGVDLFFVLSGYLITGVLLRLKEEHRTTGYWSAFYFRRLLRIAPPYLGFLIVVSILFQVPWHRIWYWYAFFGANLASGLGKCEIHSMDPLWSLAVEEQFSFIWPAVVLFSSGKRLRQIAVGIMLAAPLLRAIFTLVLSDRGPIYTFLLFRADLLAGGAFIAVCVAEDREWIERWRAMALVSLVTAASLLMGFSAFRSFRLNANSEFFNTLGYSLIMVVCASALVRALGMRQGWGRAIFASWPLRYLGQISYTFYLYQVAVMDKLGQHIGSHLEVVILGFLITGAFSALSWHFFESPILKLRRGQLTPPLSAA
jgi:peptidoglycan/LPS O-acetylase OafA/YrhL